MLDSKSFKDEFLFFGDFKFMYSSYGSFDSALRYPYSCFLTAVKLFDRAQSELTMKSEFRCFLGYSTEQCLFSPDINDPHDKTQHCIYTEL